MKTVILTIFVAMTAFNAYATPLTYTFNEWNYNNTLGNYGTVSIEATTYNSANAIKFTVDANNAIFEGSPLTWDKFYFNYVGGDALDSNKFDFSSMPNSSAWDMIGGGNVSSFGVLLDQAKYKGSTVNSDPLIFYYTDSGSLTASSFINQNEDGTYFASHLRNISSPDFLDGSVFLAAGEAAPVSEDPVPEPCTIILVGTGLFGYVCRRKKIAK